jgi:hypothetical protein
MRRLHLNLTMRAWRNMRRDWHPPLSAALLWQSFGAGSVFSGIGAMQARMAADVQSKARLDHALVILGYWRSGTTLLHELLAASGLWSFPTTRACMNPQSFLFGQTKYGDAAPRCVSRPMDDMVIRADSPQEDEFALLGLGARSPYEALLFPEHLDDALRLADPADLSTGERLFWRDTFLTFARNVSGSQNGLPLLLKSPTHACRIGTLREMLPGCRFVVVVRDPLAVFESTVRMWRKLFECYAMTRIPPDDVIRAVVLDHRPAFEGRLRQGLSNLSEDEYTLVRFEDLTEKPSMAIARIYRDLRLDGLEMAVRVAERESANRAEYVPRSRPPPEAWLGRIKERWTEVFERYGFPY